MKEGPKVGARRVKVVCTSRPSKVENIVRRAVVGNIMYAVCTGRVRRILL